MQAPDSPVIEASTPALDVAELDAQLEEPEVVQTLPDVRELDENFDTAFQLAMNRGPLCAEPVVGMAYFVEAVDLNSAEMTISQGSCLLAVI